MICLEVKVNGQQRTVAGVSSAQVINATVPLYPRLTEGWLEVTGSLAPEAQPIADASWLAAAVSTGDVVE